MKHSTLLACTLLALPAVSQERAQVGSKLPDIAFPEFLNGDGRQKLSQFFGQPVVIIRWGKNSGPCIAGSVPSAIKRDHELKPRGLVTILVEVQGADAITLEALLWKKFPTNDCASCVNVPLPIPESSELPHGCVIGVDGTLLWAGNPIKEAKKIDTLVEAELIKVRKGWGENAEAKRVRSTLYDKGYLADAHTMTTAMQDGPEKTAVQAEVDARYKSAKAAIVTLKDLGRYVAARERARQLAKNLGRRYDWLAEVARLDTLETPEAKAELALDEKLEEILRLLRDKKGEKAMKALQDLPKDGANLKVHARATRLLTALQMKLED